MTSIQILSSEVASSLLCSCMQLLARADHLVGVKGRMPPLQGYLAHKNPPPYDPTVALFLGTYRDPRGVGVSYERDTPVYACTPYMPGKHA